jgi:tetratricopeptide (TPR) repeat protein
LRKTLILFFLAAGAAVLIAETPASKPSLSPEARGDVFMARKMYREAIDSYSRAPENSAPRWNKMGIAYHQLMDLPAARRNYERALKIDPQYGEAINNRGAVFYGEKSYRRAIREYKRALRIDPNSALVYSNLGMAYFVRKDYKHAAESYQQALKLDPEVFEHRGNFGVLLQENVVSEPGKFHYYLAKTYARQGMDDRALQCIRKSLEEGFSDRKKYLEEPEFAGLRENRQFIEILNSDPRVL